MTPRLLALSLAPLLAAGSALAQAPGELPPAPPPSSPAPATPDPSARPSVMAHRWAIGLSVGGFAVAPTEAVDPDPVQFHVGELAIRYRASRRLELALAMSGGSQAAQEVVTDGNDDYLSTGSVTLALRYRFRPEQRWNWYVMAGLGGTVIAPHESTAEERDGATRPLGMLGIGVEHRFRRFALQAELRMIGIGPRQDAMDAVPVAEGGAQILPLLPVSAPALQTEQLSGGMFTLGASYYF